MKSSSFTFQLFSPFSVPGGEMFHIFCPGKDCPGDRHSVADHDPGVGGHGGGGHWQGGVEVGAGEGEECSHTVDMTITGLQNSQTGCCKIERIQ